MTWATDYTMGVNVIAEPLELDYLDNVVNTSTYMTLKVVIAKAGGECELSSSLKCSQSMQLI